MGERLTYENLFVKQLIEISQNLGESIVIKFKTQLTKVVYTGSESKEIRNAHSRTFNLQKVVLSSPQPDWSLR